jgi:hypothetical protein
MNDPAIQHYIRALALELLSVFQLTCKVEHRNNDKGPKNVKQLGEKSTLNVIMPTKKPTLTTRGLKADLPFLIPK